ncbi:hypothetical protein Tco_1497482 [Tanacetum coccineum]
MSQRRLLASLQAPFLKEKKGVRFSALYLQQKRNLLISWYSNSLDQKMAITYAIFEGENSESNVINTVKLGLSILERDVTPADSAHPFESPPAGKTDITEWLFRWIIASQDETTGPSVHPEDATSTKMVHETLSHADAESGGNSEKVGSNSGKLHVSLAGPNPEHMDDELTEVEEEAVAREVHATHARIVSGPDPEPIQEDQTGSNSGKLHVSLAGPNPEHMDDEFLSTAYPKLKVSSR